MGPARVAGKKQMLNIEPATRVLIDLIEGVRNDQLTAPTPCRECTLGGQSLQEIQAGSGVYFPWGTP